MTYQLVMTHLATPSSGRQESAPDYSDMLAGECPYRVGDQVLHTDALFTVTSLRAGPGTITFVDCELAPNGKAIGRPPLRGH